MERPNLPLCRAWLIAFSTRSLVSIHPEHHVDTPVMETLLVLAGIVVRELCLSLDTCQL